MSPTLQQLLKDHSGYRSDEHFNGDDILIQDVIQYEYMELGNDDIIDYFESHYHFNPCNLNLLNQWLTQEFGTTQIYGYWFTTQQSAIELYTSFSDELITEFELPQVFKIGSDLDDEGALFMSPTPKSELPMF